MSHAQYTWSSYTLAFIELPVIGIRSPDVVVPRKFLSIMSWFVFVLWFSEVWCKIFVLRCNSCLCVQLDGGWCKICSETFLFHLICDFTTTSPNFGDIALKKRNVLLTLHSRFVSNQVFFSMFILMFFNILMET